MGKTIIDRYNNDSVRIDRYQQLISDITNAYITVNHGKTVPQYIQKSFPGFPTRSKHMSISTAPGLNPFPISSTHRFISRQSSATRQVQLSTATSWSFSPVTWITWFFKTLSRWISQQVIRSVSFFRCHWLIMRTILKFRPSHPSLPFPIPANPLCSSPLIPILSRCSFLMKNSNLCWKLSLITAIWTVCPVQSIPLPGAVWRSKTLLLSKSGCRSYPYGNLRHRTKSPPAGYCDFFLFLLYQP